MTRLRIACTCGLKAYDSRGAAEVALDKVRRLGLRKDMPEQIVSCRFGIWHLADPMPSSRLERATELAPVSAKREAENRVRRRVAHATFGRNPVCRRPGCTSPARDCHEPLTRGRGGSITDPKNMVPLCGPCHAEIQLGPQWAYDLGLMVHSWDGGDAS